MVDLTAVAVTLLALLVAEPTWAVPPAVWLALSALCVSAAGAVTGLEFRRESPERNDAVSRRSSDLNVYPAE
jgi:hypothetical protein